ncbi:hypothetical protein KR018_000972, partial [Drosophila ironensis]
SAMASCYCPVTHVIFDCDGTLMDTEANYRRAVRDIVSEYGHTFTKEDQARYVGMAMDPTSVKIVEEYKLPMKWQEFRRRFSEVDKLKMGNVDLLPGAHELILHLHEFRIPFAIATCSDRASIKLKFSSHQDIRLCFHHIVCGDDPQLKGRVKPEPDIYLLAASRFYRPVKPKDCLVFEDSPTGLKAARAAGMQVVYIPENKFSRKMGVDPTLVLNSMAEFQPELFGLPAYTNCSKFTFG